MSSTPRLSREQREQRAATPWYVFTDTIPESSHATWGDAMASAPRVAAYRKRRARIVRVPYAPDGHWRNTPPWAGGTWGGLCGSTHWLRGDTGGRVECLQRMRHLGECRDASGLVTWDPYESIKYVPAQGMLL